MSWDNNSGNKGNPWGRPGNDGPGKGGPRGGGGGYGVASHLIWMKCCVKRRKISVP